MLPVPCSCQVIKVSGRFSRAGGFQILLDQSIVTPPEQSLVYFMDADMIAYPGFMQRTMSFGECSLPCTACV